MHRVATDIVIYPDPKSRALVLEHLLGKRRYRFVRKTVGPLSDHIRSDEFNLHLNDTNNDIAAFFCQFGWHYAFLYYCAIRDYPYVDYALAKGREFDEARMIQYALVGPPPERIKGDRKKAGQSYPLPKPRLLQMSTEHALREAHISGSAPFDVNALSDALFYTYGKIGTLSLPVQGDFFLKTSPSGGARHSIEAYVIPMSNSAIEPGVYHYDCVNHSLDRLPTQVSPDEVLASIYDSKLTDYEPQFALIMTSVIERSMWRYREPRTYRVVLHDLGHILETAKFSWRAVGGTVQCCYAFDDARLNSILQLDSLEEPVMSCLLIY